jgi:hypothetical protein
MWKKESGRGVGVPWDAWNAEIFRFSAPINTDMTDGLNTIVFIIVTSDYLVDLLVHTHILHFHKINLGMPNNLGGELTNDPPS